MILSFITSTGHNLYVRADEILVIVAHNEATNRCTLRTETTAYELACDPQEAVNMWSTAMGYKTPNLPKVSAPTPAPKAGKPVPVSKFMNSKTPKRK